MVSNEPDRFPPSARSLPRFVNRERELAQLQELADRGEPALALLYGRRRVGKTYLLDHAWRNERVFYFLAGDTTPELNRKELLHELKPFLEHPDDADPALYPSWRHVFRLFSDLATEERFIVVLDEFQNLLGKEEDVASQLMAVWDREVRDRHLVIVACGSEVSTMESLASGAGPLYGRWSWTARLKPFDYLNAARMLPGRPYRELATLYGILGGTPRYLATIRPTDDAVTRLCQAFLSPNGEIHVQVERVLEQEQGIRDRSDYQAVLTAVANGRTTVSDVAGATGLQDRPHTVRRALAVLQDLEFVYAERNFDAGAREAHRHRIAENALRFWYRFVYPNRSRLEVGDVRAVWDSAVAPHLDQYMGKVFERLVEEAYARLHREMGLAAALQWARWEGADRNRRPIEVDLVARLEDGRVLTGEVEWSSSPVSSALHGGLVRNLEDLGASGQGWAKDALDPARSAGHLYVSAAGFTEEFRALALKSPNIRLVDLDDLYAPLRREPT